ncbi:MAG: tetratricopeptide repeat protein [Paracoccaceae bacterium]|nr:tetratricopeptide repeat protein [Paracoccaceae bacterium]
MLIKKSLLLALTLGLLEPAAAQEGLAGPYLAARHASFAREFQTASKYLEQVVGEDSSNIDAMETLILSKIALGVFEDVYPIADRIVDDGVDSQVAHVALITRAVRVQDFKALVAQLDAQKGIGHQVVDGLLLAWANVGAGDAQTAFAIMDGLKDQEPSQGLVSYHRALMHHVMGDFESAEAIFKDIGQQAGALSRRAVIVRLQSLMAQGEFNQAEAVLEKYFGENLDPELLELQDDIKASRMPNERLIGSVADGIAEVFFAIAKALSSEAQDEYSLMHARVAELLSSEHVEAILLAANVLENMGQYELATKVYQEISPDNPIFHLAELGRAEALRDSGNVEAAIEALENLTRSHPLMVRAYRTLGNILRYDERYQEAIEVFNDAIELTDPKDQSAWRLFYARGIAYERLNKWPKADRDFRKALQLNPDQPLVLNYLGYSLVEKKIQLDEALAMIEKAVDLRPSSGFIVDSLGWVLFRMQKYKEAVPHLERAAELEPVDPIVNDHLGDVYWAVGRKREAYFQWQRALSFDPEEAEADRIRRKLDVGLDVVLQEEGADPLTVAQSDD